jgi:hypothetical protein
VLWGLWYFNHGRGQYARARQLAEQVLALAQIGEDPALLLEANHAMRSTAVAMGRPAEAVDYFQQGLPLYEPSRRRLYGTHDPGVCCRSMSAIASWLSAIPSRRSSRPGRP